MGKRKLSLIEVFGLSIAVVAPTGAMAFNTAGTAAAAGTAVPLAFLLGGIGVLFVGISFVELAHRIPGEGSAYAYNSKALGEKAGFISGWALTLTYLAYTFGCASISANFANVFLKHLGISLPVPLYVFFALFLGWIFSRQGIEFSTRFALVLELISVVVLGTLAFIIIFNGGQSGNSLRPFTLSGTSLSGLGTGMVFPLLSFAGFEGATTIAPRAQRPNKAVSVAILGTVLFAILFFILVSYAEVIGFGINNIDKLAGSSAPLNYLASHYVGNYMAVFIDFASSTSYFACYIGALNAASFMLEALAKNGYLNNWLSYKDSKKSTPTHAIDLVSILALIVYLVFGIKVGATNYYNYCGTIGTLSLLLVYVLVNVGAIRYFKYRIEGYSFIKHRICPLIGILVLIYPIYSNFWPVPVFPMNMFPYFVFFWIIFGWIISFRRKMVTSENVNEEE